MKIGTFRFPSGDPRRGVLVGADSVLDVDRALAAGYLGRGEERAADLLRDTGQYWWLTSDGLALLRELVQSLPGAATEHRYSLDQARPGPPVPWPGKVLAAGRNYESHLAEGQEIWEQRGRRVVRPPFPSGFVKIASSLVGDGDAIHIPRNVNTVDYEIELAVVIGRTAQDVSVGDALAYVAGYTVANDVAARQLQFEEMEQLGLLVSKNFPTFAPMGPWITTADEILDPQELTLKLWVGDELRQEANTQDMLFSVAELVASWSRMRLDPGDVIITGTPSGVAAGRPVPDDFYLRHGDTVTAEIGGLGQLRNTVREAKSGESRG